MSLSIWFHFISKKFLFKEDNYIFIVKYVMSVWKIARILVAHSYTLYSDVWWWVHPSSLIFAILHTFGMVLLCLLERGLQIINTPKNRKTKRNQCSFQMLIWVVLAFFQGKKASVNFSIHKFTLCDKKTFLLSTSIILWGIVRYT